MNSIESKTYVAPPEPPPSRRPPAREVGVYGWLKHNLFATVGDSISTLLTLAAIIFVGYRFSRWVLTDAQWEIAFLNTRQLFVGTTFPIAEIWRINLAAYVLVFLCLLAISYWAGLSRVVVILVSLLAFALILVPLLATPITKPLVHYWLDGQKIDQVNFVANEGDTLIFKIDPLTSPNDFGLENFGDGYIGNDKSLPNTSWNLFDTNSSEVRNGLIDPSDFDLNLAIQIWDAEGEVLVTSEFTGGEDREVSLEWTAPADSWYTFTAIRDEENAGETGFAWLKVENLQIFTSTVSATRARQAKYGDPPELDCLRCNTQSNRTDMRYVGLRSVPQWLSIQISPFFVSIRQFVFLSILAGVLGHLLSWVLKQNIIPEAYHVQIIGGLWLLGAPVWFILIKGIGVEPFTTIRTLDMGGLLLTLIVTAIPLIVSFPLGVLLALGRRSDLPAVSFFSTMFIEVFRGVPLITLLFMGLYIIQFFADFLRNVDVIVRMMIVLTVFTAAYLAEVIRGGLQVIPKGQLEAAQAVGLSGFWTTMFIILPQALRAVIPAILGQFLSLFKDTSLLALVGLFEIIGTMSRILGDPVYLAYGTEGWLFIFIIFFALSYAMAEVSRKLEETGSGAVRRKQI